MIFNFALRTSATRVMHSPDLDDMRRAIVDEDQDGPDGGDPDVRRLRLVKRPKAS